MAKKKSYYQRPDGLFESIRRINGKRVAFRGKTCREVDRKILEYREQAEKGRKLPEIAEQWLDTREVQVRASTYLSNAGAVKKLSAAFPGYASEIKPIDIQRYMFELERQGVSSSTARSLLTTLRMVLSYAVLCGDIDISPATDVALPKGMPRKERDALTEAQEALVKAPGRAHDGSFGLLGMMLLYTGMRRGEALALTFTDIDRKAGVIHVTKKLGFLAGRPVLDDFTKSDNGIRDIPLLPPLAAVLPKNRIGLVFPSENGGFMQAGEFQRRWKAYCRDIGLTETGADGKTVYPITPHCFRHSFATICYESGIDYRQAAQLFGDTPEVMMKVYTHLREGQKQDAADKLTAYFVEA